MNSRIVYLIGGGALAKAIVDTLSISGISNIVVYIYSRSYSASSWIATIGNARSRAFANSQTYIPKEINWENELSLTDNINTFQPYLIIHTASLQSMWNLNEENKWARLVRSVGYGITLPLQSKLALQLCKGIAAASYSPLLINCCYPDAVNFVLKKCNFNVLCGIGNIGIIEMVLPPILDTQNFLMIANHFHVQQLTQLPQKRTKYPRLWIENAESKNVKSIFDKVILSNDVSLNSITSVTCVKLISAIINQENTTLHLPGPNGWPGGYPVKIKGGKIAHIGTDMIASPDEQAWNKEIIKEEGLLLNEHAIEYSEKAFEEISIYSREIAAGFRFNEVNDYIGEFLLFKEKLSNSN